MTLRKSAGFCGWNEYGGLFTPVREKHVFVRLREEWSVSQTFLTDVTFMGCAPVCLLPGGAVDAQARVCIRLLHWFYFEELLRVTLIDS